MKLGMRTPWHSEQVVDGGSGMVVIKIQNFNLAQKIEVGRAY